MKVQSRERVFLVSLSFVKSGKKYEREHVFRASAPSGLGHSKGG